MKADVARKDAESAEAAPAPAPRAPRSGELPLAGEEAADEDGDVFKEIPTVANRALAVPEGGPPQSPASSHETAGSYRLVRPTVSDFVAQPVATKIEPATATGVLVPQARKPR